MTYTQTCQSSTLYIINSIAEQKGLLNKVVKITGLSSYDCLCWKECQICCVQKQRVQICSCWPAVYNQALAAAIKACLQRDRQNNGLLAQSENMTTHTRNRLLSRITERIHSTITEQDY